MEVQKGNNWLSLRNIFIIFFLSGFWHGSNWTFIIWGMAHALLYVPLFLMQKNRQYTTTIVSENSFLPTFKELLQMITTYFFIMITWVFFRSENINNSFEYLSRMVTTFRLPSTNYGGLVFVFILLLFDWLMRKDERNPINFR